MAFSSTKGRLLDLSRVVNVLVLVLMCVMLVAHFRMPEPAAARGPTELKFYVHERKTPPASLILVAPEAGDLSLVAWGSLVVIDNDVRETEDPNSNYLGRQLGTVAVGIDNLTFYTQYTYLLNTTDYEGSIVVAGVVQSKALVITGGTHTFSCVQGVASVELLYNTTTAALFHVSLELHYPLPAYRPSYLNLWVNF